MSDLIERLMICAKYDPDQKEAAEEILRLRENLRQLYEMYIDLVFDYLAVKVKLEELEGKTNDDTSRNL